MQRIALPGLRWGRTASVVAVLALTASLVFASRGTAQEPQGETWSGTVSLSQEIGKEGTSYWERFQTTITLKQQPGFDPEPHIQPYTWHARTDRKQTGPCPFGPDYEQTWFGTGTGETTDRSNFFYLDGYVSPSGEEFHRVTLPTIGLTIPEHVTFITCDGRESQDILGGVLGGSSHLAPGAATDDELNEVKEIQAPPELGGALTKWEWHLTRLPDRDSDGKPDATDNCPDDPNPRQENNDGDAQGDVCDPDDDNDGLSDINEASRGTDPFDPDTDNDGLEDGDEVARGTNPLVADTDGGGVKDGDEVSRGTNPLNPSDDGNPACSDGLDNDGDGRTDHPADPGCSSPTDTDETNAGCDAKFTSAAFEAEGTLFALPDPHQFNFSVGIPWCTTGSQASLRGGVDSVTTTGVDLGPTFFSVALETYMNITFRAKPEARDVSARQLGNGVLEVTAQGEFDTCLNPVGLIFDWVTGKLGHYFKNAKQWGKLTPAQRQALIDNLTASVDEVFKKFPKSVQAFRTFILDEFVAAVQLVRGQWVGGVINSVQVCISTWSPKVIAHLFPNGTAIVFEEGDKAAFWTIDQTEESTSG